MYLNVGDRETSVGKQCGKKESCGRHQKPSRSGISLLSLGVVRLRGIIFILSKSGGIQLFLSFFFFFFFSGKSRRFGFVAFREV